MISEHLAVKRYVSKNKICPELGTTAATFVFHVKYLPKICRQNGRGMLNFRQFFKPLLTTCFVYNKNFSVFQTLFFNGCQC